MSQPDERGEKETLAGMRIGDLIVDIEGRGVASGNDLHGFLTDWPVGEPVPVTILRGKEKTLLAMTLVEAAAS